MSFSLEDLKKITTSNKKILLLASQNPSLDIISSLLAMSRFLKKMGIKNDILLPEGIPSTLGFLGKDFPVIEKLQYARDFVLIFNTKKNPIAQIQTEKNDQEYLIKITPQKGVIHPKDFSFIPADFSYGWIILLGVSGLGKIGQPYLENPDIFFEVPKINIDNQIENEKYGQINWIEETASSLGEMLASFFLEEQTTLVDQEIARLLLTAIISGTESFQNPHTSPRSMILAAQLMKYGINQTEIVRYLYRNKSLSFLKIWGKTMSRLQWEEKNSFIYSWLSKEEFLSDGTEKEDLNLILDEVQKDFPTAKIYALFYTDEKDQLSCQLFFPEKSTAEKICPLFQQDSQQRLSLSWKKNNFLQAKKEFLEKLQAC